MFSYLITFPVRAFCATGVSIPPYCNCGLWWHSRQNSAMFCTEDVEVNPTLFLEIPQATGKAFDR